MIQPNTKITRVFFDFDNTLFDTEKKKQLFYKIAEIHGYSHDEAKKIYAEARFAGDKIIISLAGFLNALRERLERDAAPFHSVEVSSIIGKMNHGDGLLPGARYLLTFCKQKNLEQYLLSLGVRSWQEEKLNQAGIADLFAPERILYTETLDVGKIDVLKEVLGAEFAGEGSLLFNDKPDETARLLEIFPQLSALVRREARDTRYGEPEFISLEAQFPGRVAWADNLKTLHKHFISLV